MRSRLSFHLLPQQDTSADWQFHRQPQRNLHMHVIPRWEGDALHKPWDIAPANESDLLEVLQQITK